MGVKNYEQEARELRAKLLECRLLLARAGNALSIQGNQEHRALRFKILNYLKGLES